MKATIKKKSVFVAFLAFFVLFGGGRSGDWVIVCRDQGGWTYQVDLESLQTDQQSFLCEVRVQRNGQFQQALWTLDRRLNVLRVGNGPAETILPGSVASRVLRFLEAKTELGKGKKAASGE